MTNEKTDLAIRQLEESLEAGSLKAFAQSVDTPMLLIDTSGSMDERMRNGKRKIDGLREVVNDIKAKGQVPMIAFGGPYDAQVRFVDGVPEPDGGTPLHIAIPMAKEYGATRVVVISDGCPDLTEACYDAAREFGGKIDVAYVGNAGDGGEVFLKELANITGGQQFTGNLSDPKQIASGVIAYLEGEVAAPIQGAGFTTVDADPDEFEDDEDDEEEDEDDDDDE